MPAAWIPGNAQVPAEEKRLTVLYGAPDKEQNTTASVATNLSAGSYTVTVTDANGCENIASITIGDPNYRCLPS